MNAGTFIQDRDGFLWMGASGGGGIIRFDPRAGKIWAFSASDGLQGNVFSPLNGIRDRDGEMWFAGPKGLNSFYPREIVDNTFVPPVVVTALKSGGEEMALGRSPERVIGITLDWQSNFFEFEYAAGTIRCASLDQTTMRYGTWRGSPSHSSTIDMTEMVGAILQELVLQADRERIELHVADMPPSEGDPTLIRQVWQNLLTNAIKLSFKRVRPVIEVGGQQDTDGNTYWVRDNGAGFDMEYAKKLFGVFQRLHSETEFPGKGVGLAIVQRVINRHGGNAGPSRIPSGSHVLIHASIARGGMSRGRSGGQAAAGLGIL